MLDRAGVEAGRRKGSTRGCVYGLRNCGWGGHPCGGQHWQGAQDGSALQHMTMLSRTWGDLTVPLVETAGRQLSKPNPRSLKHHGTPSSARRKELAMYGNMFERGRLYDEPAPGEAAAAADAASAGAIVSGTQGATAGTEPQLRMRRGGGRGGGGAGGPAGEDGDQDGYGSHGNGDTEGEDPEDLLSLDPRKRKVGGGRVIGERGWTSAWRSTGPLPAPVPCCRGAVAPRVAAAAVVLVSAGHSARLNLGHCPIPDYGTPLQRAAAGSLGTPPHRALRHLSNA